MGCDIALHAFPKCKGGVAKLLLNLGHKWVITPNGFMQMQVFSQTSDISRILVGNKIVDDSDVVRTSRCPN